MKRNGHYIDEDGYQVWYQNDKWHRIDGPAIIYGDYQEWYKEGKLHRLDGPAYINGNYQSWWIEGEQYTKEQFIMLLPIKRIFIMTKNILRKFL